MAKLGNCYEANGKKFLDLVKKNSNINVVYHMVHGVVVNQRDKNPMGHAWIELTFSMGDFSQVCCLDYSNGCDIELSKESYYFIGKIDEQKLFRYDFKTFNAKAHESGHWGNWDLNVNR